MIRQDIDKDTYICEKISHSHLAASSPLPVARTSWSHSIVAGAIGELASGTSSRDTVSDPGCWYGIYERGLSTICETYAFFCVTRYISQALVEALDVTSACIGASNSKKRHIRHAAIRQASNREYLLTNVTPPNTFSGFSGLTEQFHLADLNWCWHSSMASLAPALTACKTVKAKNIKRNAAFGYLKKKRLFCHVKQANF